MAQSAGRSPGYDDLDFALIDALSRQPDLSNRALAERLQVAESTCTYRLRRLRETGVIGAKRYQIDHARLGYPLKAIVMVYLARHSRAIVDEFMEHVAKLPNVLNVMNLTGRADFILTVAVADGDHLGNLVLDHVTKLPTVRATESHIVFSSRDGEWIPQPVR